jgi:hypothetical protein
MNQKYIPTNHYLGNPRFGTTNSKLPYSSIPFPLHVANFADFFTNIANSATSFIQHMYPIVSFTEISLILRHTPKRV